jgi:polygalacturonase
MRRIAAISFCLLALGTVVKAQFGNLPLPVVQQPAFKADTFNIKSFGAVNDGITLNTTSINKAIAACSQKGGGVVLVPGGLWLTGPIELKNNVNLHINRDAVLMFSADFNQYPIVEGYYEGVKAGRCQSPISGRNLENIAITGTGIVDGNGDAWRMVKREKLNTTQWGLKIASGGLLSADGKTWYPSEKSVKGSTAKEPGVLKEGVTLKDFEVYKDYLRPNMVALYSCNKVLLEGVTFQNSPAWNLHPFLCSNITLRGVSVKNPWYAQNGDGIDLESSDLALIENSTFDVGDDGICIKSGKDAQGRKLGKATQDVIVRNCIVYHAHGGFVIGSEMSGGAKNIFVYNCSFMGTDVGLRFKTARGRGGVVEKIYVDNINMKDIASEAVLFDMYYEAKDPVVLAGEVREQPKVVMMPVTEATPQFKDFHVSNIYCSGAQTALFIRGLPEMNINNIYLDNMVITAKKGIVCTQASDIHIKNFKMILADTKPVMSIDESHNVSLDGISYNNNANLLFKLSGVHTAGIAVSNTNTASAKNKVEFTDGATAKSIDINKN